MPFLTYLFTRNLSLLPLFIMRRNFTNAIDYFLAILLVLMLCYAKFFNSHLQIYIKQFTPYVWGHWMI